MIEENVLQKYILGVEVVGGWHGNPIAQKHLYPQLSYPFIKLTERDLASSIKSRCCEERKKSILCMWMVWGKMCILKLKVRCSICGIHYRMIRLLLTRYYSLTV